MMARWASLAASRAVASAACSAWEAAAQLRCMAVGSRASGGAGSGGMSDTLKWKWLKSQGAEVNPCNSAEHPSVMAGMPPSGDEVSVQQAYNPGSSCFGCGATATLTHPAADNIHLSAAERDSVCGSRLLAAGCLITKTRKLGYMKNTLV